jgi:hypothetical protein
VLLADDLRDDQRRDELPLCCALVHAMRFGRPYGEEKGKRASAAAPKGRSESEGEATLVGLIRYPVVGAPQPSWRSNVDQALADATATINANLAETLNGLALLFRHPMPM